MLTRNFYKCWDNHQEWGNLIIHQNQSLLPEPNQVLQHLSGLAIFHQVHTKEYLLRIIGQKVNLC